MVMTIASTPPSKREASMRRPATSKVPPTRLSGSDTKLAVNAQNAAYRSTSARPNVPRICASIGPRAMSRTKPK